MSTTDLSRVITLDAVHNFRDLGGYPTADGRTTRWRTLYRADGLYRLSGDDLEAVRDLGLKTVIDLRTFTELDKRGRFPVGEVPVAFHHLPIMDVTWSAQEFDPQDTPIAQFLFERYLDMIETGEPRIVTVFSVLAEPDALPAVFHCAAGKDRTGIVAALLLSSIGVSDEDVVADYALTGEAMARMRAWAELNQPEWMAIIEASPAAFLAAHPDAMRSLLRLIRDVYGSPRDYVRSLGVTDEVLAKLEANLLTD
jgi:protein-tyrosine phosphatase